MRHFYHLELYKVNFSVCFDAKEHARYLEEGEEFVADLLNCGGMASRLDDDSVTVYLPIEDGKIDVGNAAHEAFHLADYVADIVGMEYARETGNEHIAYLVGWFTDAILAAYERQELFYERAKS